jgi:hypothetical protein
MSSCFLERRLRSRPERAMGDTVDGVVAHGVRHRGGVRRVGTRATAGAARDAVEEHLACAQGHQGSGVDTMGRSEKRPKEPVM